MRILEWLFALFLLVVTLPVILVALIVIRLDSAGAPLLVQTRVGRGKRPFPLFKLRTMRAGTKVAGTHEVSAAQVTKVGAFLRRTKLDELPQLLNILRGDMRFVGPRPCLPSQTKLIAERDSRGVYAVHPGITGAAQVAGIDMSDPVRLAIADAAYIGDRSTKGDLRLMWQTFRGGGRGDRTSA